MDLLIFRQYNKRWLVLNEENIAYSNSNLVEMGKGCYAFDMDFRCSLNPNNNLELTLENSTSSLTLKFDSLFDKLLWKKEIDKRHQKHLVELKDNPYTSFATAKSSNEVKWFSDGEDYWKDLYESLMKAKREVLITDWWMSPEVYLNRPANYGLFQQMSIEGKKTQEEPPFTRLMDVLAYLANVQKVQIYIMVYAEQEMALTLNSKHTCDTLNSLSENIHAISHPHDIDVLLWSHHEKLVVIDQNVGYVGGLDLCWGRFDTHSHPLIEPANKEKSYLFPGIDYSNARINDFTDVPNYLKENVDRNTTPRMPWHDVHIRIEGPAVPDIARHFIQRWNNHVFESRGAVITGLKTNTDYTAKTANAERKHKKPKKEEKEEKAEEKEGWMASVLRQVEENEKAQKEEEPKKEEKKSMELIDTTEGTKEDTKEEEKKEEGKEEEKKEEGKVEEEEIPKKKINPLVGLVKKKKKEEAEKKEDDENNPDLLKKPLRKDELLFAEFLKGKLFVDKDHAFKKRDGYNKFVKNVAKTGNTNQKLLPDDIQIIKQNMNIVTATTKKGKKKTARANVQVLRSGCSWSIGLKQTEHSILNGYYKLIDGAEHFIYIENQFFVSRSWDESERNGEDLSEVVENQIAYHIRKRIERAINEEKDFKVVVFIPLLPGFAGEPEESGTLQLIMKHSYAGMINNKGFSIIEKVQKLLQSKGRPKEDAFKYINFYSLRNHALINGVPKTEIIYIHSKLMIVDDTKLLIGSANINDRSMLGTRDSEFAVIVEDRNYIHSTMNGDTNYKAANFAATFRRALYAEHIGLEGDDPRLIDPLGEEINKVLNERAKTNTETYRMIFNCYPDDNFYSFKKLRKKEEICLPDLVKLYEANADKIKGHVVYFPLKFLEDEIDNLGTKFFTAEGLLPDWNYT
ncbi:MAG: phospholipase D-like domain-containing protein [archaeon]|nr:phospholipase D-like domain-containing protein [archaeon]